MAPMGRDSSNQPPDSPPSSAADHDVFNGDVHHPPLRRSNRLPVASRRCALYQGEEGRAVSRDIRRYYCNYCGICRSKKSLIRSHMLAHHKDKMLDAQDSESNAENEASGNVSHTCQECGANFRKPAYLKQHMQSHYLERPFACTLDDCHFSYRRKDHLTRHLLKHQGKIFNCPVDGCTYKFAYQGNMKRHVKELHDCESPFEGEKHQGKIFNCPVDGCTHKFAFRGNMKRHMKKLHDCESPSEGEKQHVCEEVGCGKKFKYASRLRKHEETHVKLECVEVICSEPGCMKPFKNAEYLKAHARSCHRYVQCEVCGTQQLKKNIKRHLHIHEEDRDFKIKCSFKGCLYVFSNKSNLNKHVKAVHEELRPFICRISGCGQKFLYRHVRDNHEKSGTHVYVQGDFIEADEQFQSRSRGGRKRKCLSVDTLLRKRVVPPSQASSLDDGTEYLRWLLSDDQN